MGVYIYIYIYIGSYWDIKGYPMRERNVYTDVYGLEFKVWSLKFSG